MLKRFISWFVGWRYPNHIFYGKKFLQDIVFPGKEDGEEEYSPTKAAALILSSEASSRLNVGDILTSEFTNIRHDERGLLGSYRVMVERLD